METLGSRLRKIREDLRLSQDGFGAKIGLSKQSVSNFEKDRSHPSAATLSKLLLDYDVSLNWLFSGIGTPFLNQEQDTDLDKMLQEAGYYVDEEGILRKKSSSRSGA